MTVITLDQITILEPILEQIPVPIAQPELFTLSPEEIDRILAEVSVRPKRPADPCLLKGVSAGFSDEPITEYQDSMDAAGYPYW